MEDFEALSTIVGILKELDSDTQKRVLQSVQTFLGIAPERTPNEMVTFSDFAIQTVFVPSYSAARLHPRATKYSPSLAKR